MCAINSWWNKSKSHIKTYVDKYFPKQHTIIALHWYDSKFLLIRLQQETLASQTCKQLASPENRDLTLICPILTESARHSRRNNSRMHFWGEAIRGGDLSAFNGSGNKLACVTDGWGGRDARQYKRARREIQERLARDAWKGKCLNRWCRQSLRACWCQTRQTANVGKTAIPIEDHHDLRS